MPDFWSAPSSSSTDQRELSKGKGQRWGADVQKGETKPNPTKKKKAKSEKLLSVGRNTYPHFLGDNPQKETEKKSSLFPRWALSLRDPAPGPSRPNSPPRGSPIPTRPPDLSEENLSRAKKKPDETTFPSEKDCVLIRCAETKKSFSPEKGIKRREMA